MTFARCLSGVKVLLIMTGLFQMQSAFAHGEFRMEYGIDRPGMDFKNHFSVNEQACAEACSNEPQCLAFSYTLPGYTGGAGYVNSCYLKYGVPAGGSSRFVVSGVRSQGGYPPGPGYPPGHGGGGQGRHFTVEQGIDRPGSDIVGFYSPSPQDCQSNCAANRSCLSYSYTLPGFSGGGAAPGMCFLKNTVPYPVSHYYVVSGVRRGFR